MKLYITTENHARVKKSFINLKGYNLIIVENILEEFGYSYNTIDDYGSFMVNKRIRELMTGSPKTKIPKNIVYINPYLTKETLENIFNISQDIYEDTSKVLLDDYNVPKMKDYYNMFDEIIYFPLIKKVRLIDTIEIK
ncbi:MAG: hypothetical protein RSC92_05805 [Clostridia bacterium]